MKRLTPTQAIRKHCLLFCMNGSNPCEDGYDCFLKHKAPALKRIKEFCKECIKGAKPKECDGIILNTEETRAFGKCPLWVFRLGKNPARQGIGRKGGNPNFTKKILTHRAF